MLLTLGLGACSAAAAPSGPGGPVQRADCARGRAEEGWHVVDPWVAVDRQGAWVPGASRDGVHPTQVTADSAGRVLRAAILDAAGDRRRRSR